MRQYLVQNLNIYLKSILILGSLLGSCLLVYYFHNNLEVEILISHSFYLSIILASFWWRKYSILVAIFCAVYLVVSCMVFLPDVELFDNFFRGIFFIIFAYVISSLANSIDKIKQEKDFIKYRYKLIFDHMSSAISYNKVIKNEAGNVIDFEILDINAHFERIFSVNKKEAIGQRFTNLFPEIKKSEFGWIPKFEEVVLKEITIYFDQYFLPLNLWFSIEAFPSTNDTFVAIFRDITPNIMAIKERENIQKQIQHSERLASIGLLAAGVGHEINNPLAIIQLNMDDIIAYSEKINIKDMYLL
ncbi:MAG: hypothetical protein AB1782_13175, partial [Cyanobacteriota bacterium]